MHHISENDATFYVYFLRKLLLFKTVRFSRVYVRLLTTLWPRVFMRRSIMNMHKIWQFLFVFAENTYRSSSKTRFLTIELLISYQYFTILLHSRDYSRDKLLAEAASHSEFVVCTLKEWTKFENIDQIGFILFVIKLDVYIWNFSLFHSIFWKGWRFEILKWPSGFHIFRHFEVPKNIIRSYLKIYSEFYLKLINKQFNYIEQFYYFVVLKITGVCKPPIFLK